MSPKISSSTTPSLQPHTGPAHTTLRQPLPAVDLTATKQRLQDYELYAPLYAGLVRSIREQRGPDLQTPNSPIRSPLHHEIIRFQAMVLGVSDQECEEIANLRPNNTTAPDVSTDGTLNLFLSQLGYTKDEYKQSGSLITWFQNLPGNPESYLFLNFYSHRISCLLKSDKENFSSSIKSILTSTLDEIPAFGGNNTIIRTLVKINYWNDILANFNLLISLYYIVLIHDQMLGLEQNIDFLDKLCACLEKKSTDSKEGSHKGLFREIYISVDKMRIFFRAQKDASKHTKLLNTLYFLSQEMTLPISIKYTLDQFVPTTIAKTDQGIDSKMLSDCIAIHMKSVNFEVIPRTVVIPKVFFDYTKRHCGSIKKQDSRLYEEIKALDKKPRQTEFYFNLHQKNLLRRKTSFTAFLTPFTKTLDGVPTPLHAFQSSSLFEPGTLGLIGQFIL